MIFPSLRRSLAQPSRARAARFRSHGLWYLLVALAPLAAPPLPAINFTEIFYDPPGTAEEKAKLKFIEIFNDCSVTVDLSGYHFAEGVVFEFPPQTLLGGRKFLVICADQAAIQARYGIKNTIGNFTGNLSGDGDQLVLLTPSGGIAAKVAYKDRGSWTTIPVGTGYTLSLITPWAENGEPSNWVPSRRPYGTPGGDNFPPPYIQETEIFGENSEWLYRKGWDGAAMAPFSTPADAWRLPGFDDSAWTTGMTGIGFAGNDDQTLLDDMMNNYLAYACRKRFTLTQDQIDAIESTIFRVRVDDGFVAYFNGQEIGRKNVGTAVEVPFDLPATGSYATTSPAIAMTIPKEKLIAGVNLFAVQVHNQALNGNDASFIPSFVYRRTVRDEPPAPVPLVINEVSRIPGPAGGLRWVELFNAGDSPLALDGFILTDDPARLDRYVFPVGQSILGRARLVINEGDLGFSLAGEGSKLTIRLFLFSSEKIDGVQRVLEAETLETKVIFGPAAVSQARLPDGGDRWYFSSSPTPGEANTVPMEKDVVINEIMYNPLGSPVATLPGGSTLDRGEFVELYNRSDRTISLEGWALTKGFNYAFLPGSKLEAGAYLVIATDPEYIRSTYSLPAEIVLGPENDPQAQAIFGNLSNSGELVELDDPLGNPVDEVNYIGGGDWPKLPDAGGSSLELIDPFQDNSFPSAWDASDETAKAPWKQYTYTSTNLAATESSFWFILLNAGEVLIDEVSVKKGDIEYIPNGGFETVLAPWRVDGTHIRSKRTTDEAHDGQACLLINASSGGDNRVNHVAVNTKPVMPAGQLTVSFWARWLKGGDKIHTSNYNNSGLSLTQVLEIPHNQGTPGKENSARIKLRQQAGGDNLGPVIAGVRHSPPVPRATDPVTILARISDPDGVKEATVEYRLSRRAAPFATAPLFDDGLHGDGEAGDGLYGGTIPPQVLNAKVLFNILAVDSGDRARRFPVNAPTRVLLYQVSDPYDSQGLRYRLIVDDDNQLTLTTRKLHSDDLLDASFVFEESEIYYNVGIRYHGSPWNRPPDPKMFRVRFRDGQPLHGQGDINISRYGSAPNEGTAYELCRRATGGPDARTPVSPRYNYLKFYYNGRPHAGASAMGEIIPPGPDYFAANFPDDSNGYCYKVTGKLDFNDAGDMTNVIWTNYKYYGPTKESYRYFYNPASRDEDDNFDPLMKLLTLMDPSKTSVAQMEDPTTGIETILNVEAFLRIFVIRALEDDWDTIGINNGQNSYFYYAPKEGRFYLLPWDMDHTFGDSNARLIPSEMSVDPGCRHLVNDSPKYRRMYLRILKEFITGFWNAPAMSPWLDAVANETKGGLVILPSAIKTFMTARVGVAKVRVPAITRVIKFAISNPAGGIAAVSGASTLTVIGTAPLELARLEVARDAEDPVAMEPTWSGAQTTDWKLTLALVPGKEKTHFSFFGFTEQGNLVGDVISLNVYDTTGWGAPQVALISPSSGPQASETPAVISGTGFHEGLTVTFGGRPATRVEYRSSTEAMAVAPLGVTAGPVDVVLKNLDGQSTTLAGGFTYTSAAVQFIRGDVDRNQKIEVTDPINLLTYLFLAGSAPPCLDAADADDSGALDVTDPILLLNYQFTGGDPPAAPFPGAGIDPTSSDPLDCQG